LINLIVADYIHAIEEGFHFMFIFIKWLKCDVDPKDIFLSSTRNFDLSHTSSKKITTSSNYCLFASILTSFCDRACPNIFFPLRTEETKIRRNSREIKLFHSS